MDEKRSRKRMLALHTLTALSVATAAGLVGLLAIMTLKGVDPLLEALYRVF
jgi:hypothetical protein